MSARSLWKPLLGYSTNVHRGDSLQSIYRYLEECTIPVRERVFGAGECGLELHLNMRTAAELRSLRARRLFGGFLRQSGLLLFSVNAYPLAPFHARRVKERVYSPSWTEAPRYRWTNIIAEILADLLPPGIEGSISTLGGAYRRKEHGAATFRKLAAGYVKTLEKLWRIEETEGKTIVLAAEPEPETTFETAGDVIEFFEGHLLPAARDAWRSRMGWSRSRSEACARRFFTVNFDTCHFSVLFEDLVSSLRRLAGAGIAIGKVHVTNAISLPSPLRSRAGYDDFRGMDEPRYLHQFSGRDRHGRVIWRGLDLDRLPRALQASPPGERTPPGVDLAELDELRSHYHVPLYLKRFRRLHTTQAETLAALREIERRRSTSHLVVETYTWPLLAPRRGLVRGIAGELRWLLDALGSRV
jgi:hypothetical protein